MEPDGKTEQPDASWVLNEDCLAFDGYVSLLKEVAATVISGIMSIKALELGREVAISLFVLKMRGRRVGGGGGDGGLQIAREVYGVSTSV